MDQVKFVEDSFYKFYLAHSWIFWLKYLHKTLMLDYFSKIYFLMIISDMSLKQVVKITVNCQNGWSMAQQVSWTQWNLQVFKISKKKKKVRV